jgi:hypothetical protein
MLNSDTFHKTELKIWWIEHIKKLEELTELKGLQMHMHFFFGDDMHFFSVSTKVNLQWMPPVQNLYLLTIELHANILRNRHQSCIMRRLAQDQGCAIPNSEICHTSAIENTSIRKYMYLNENLQQKIPFWLLSTYRLIWISSKVICLHARYSVAYQSTKSHMPLLPLNNMCILQK